MHKIAIVGRPNVGKSSLFNRLLRRRAAVVADEPGVTRDVKEEIMLYENRRILLMDTGGLWSGDEWESRILEKAEMAIHDCQAVIFAVDTRTELSSADFEIADWLRRLGKPVVIAGTKVDSYKHETLTTELYALGFGEPISTSAEHARGLDDIMDAVVKHLPEDLEDVSEVAPIRVTFIGRPNVGKSSLLNAVTGSDRVIVSPIAGTTRDAIDFEFNYAGTRFVLVTGIMLVAKGSKSGGKSSGNASADQFIDNVLASPQGALTGEKFERFDTAFMGAGDTLAAALAALLAAGGELEPAVGEALSFLDQSLDAGFRPGMGHIVPDRLFWAQSDDDADESDDEAEDPSDDGSLTSKPTIDLPPNGTLKH